MSNQPSNEISTTCCVVGGGPAGMMTGFLLARAGIDVVVLEKHSDFLRDFRGDTVHPSTLEVMHELGLLEELLTLPHHEEIQVGGQLGDHFYRIADFSRLPTKCKFIALMPQWDFLNFLAEKAGQHPSFHLHMNAEVTDVLIENERVVGVKARTKDGDLVIKAQLTIGADGRGSIVRDRAGFEVEDIGAPMDVLWFKISRNESDPGYTFGRIKAGVIMIMLNRDDYWQCGFVIAKGKFEQYKQEGIEQFRNRVKDIAPFLEDRLEELIDWDHIKLLTVKIDRLKEWCREGLLCIGDSAHAMSPIGGVGINLAIQDAVAAANILYRPLLDGKLNLDHLHKVQERRHFPTVMTQSLQVLLQTRFVKPTLESTKPLSPPTFLQMMDKHPRLRSIPATIVGIGFRAEHIHCPDNSLKFSGKSKSS
jgi:2-polyprenyl-6-methoxyphenol hydroxylase-like FAD-dependent oxidoreductase